MSTFNLTDLRHLMDRVLLMSGFEFIGPDTCDPLAKMISHKTGYQISETTIKQLYGFIPAKFLPSSFTVQTLVKYCGYESWSAYQSSLPGTQSYLINAYLHEGSLRRFFDHSAQAMWIFSIGNLRFLDVNEAACHTYGFSRQEFIEKTILDIRPPEDVSKVLNAVNSAGALCYHAEPFRHILSNGALIDVDIISYALIYQGQSARLVLPLQLSSKRTEEPHKKD